MEKKGKIKISSENMMPIIKKWLYSDKDIFLIAERLFVFESLSSIIPKLSADKTIFSPIPL